MTPRNLRRLRVIGLVLAVGLLPLVVGVVFVQRGAQQYAGDTRERALAEAARSQASTLAEYFARSRSVILLAARDASIRRLVDRPGGRERQLEAAGELRTVNGALDYLERLYPSAINEACLIDGRGRELARVVRGVRAARADLSLEEAKSPFFAPTFALRPGEVFQAAPYVSPDTDEWVISNSTPVPARGRGRGGAMLHFEVTVESFRRRAAAIAGRFDIAVVDAATGRVAFDSRIPVRRGEPSTGDALRFGALRGYASRPDVVELPGTTAAVHPLAAAAGNANRWLVVATPVGAASGGLDQAIIPLVLLTVALLLGVGVALAHRYQRLTDAAHTDLVTNLPNRRAFAADLEGLVADTTGERPLSVLVLDLDGLEQINGTDGQSAGDRLLASIATHLCGHLPDHCRAYRLVGSQFAVTTPRGAWGALELAGALHQALQSDQGIALRIGVAHHSPGGSAETLLRSADLAAAEARRSGRGVLVHTPGLDVSPAEAPDASRQHVLASALARAVDAKDAYTRSHCETVAELSALVASQLGLPPERVARVRLAGLVHDVGKIGVPDAILQKPAALTDEEYATIKEHSAAGHRILAGTDLAAESEWVRHHHERVDGGGYPDGVSGDELVLEARILHVADAFEAMTSDRPYRAGMPEADAVDELLRHSGSQFDPQCVAALVESLAHDGLPAVARDVELAVAP